MDKKDIQGWPTGAYNRLCKACFLDISAKFMPKQEVYFWTIHFYFKVTRSQSFSTTMRDTCSD